MSTSSPTSYRIIWTAPARRNVAALRDAAISHGSASAERLLAKLRKITKALTWVLRIGVKPISNSNISR